MTNNNNHDLSPCFHQSSSSLLPPPGGGPEAEAEVGGQRSMLSLMEWSIMIDNDHDDDHHKNHSILLNHESTRRCQCRVSSMCQLPCANHWSLGASLSSLVVRIRIVAARARDAKINQRLVEASIISRRLSIHPVNQYKIDYHEINLPRKWSCYVLRAVCVIS